MMRSSLCRWGTVLVLAALQTGAARAGDVTDGHEHMLAALTTAGTDPETSTLDAALVSAAVFGNFQARWGAITPLAVFEAADASVGNYEPYLEGIDAQDSTSPDAAALAAAYGKAQSPGGGSGNSVTTTVIHPVSTFAETCVVSGNLKAIITATPTIGGTASVAIKLKPMGCKGSCGVVNGQLTLSGTVTIGVPAIATGGLHFSHTQCGISHASATCKYVVNADGTATVAYMLIQAYCMDY